MVSDAKNSILELIASLIRMLLAFLTENNMINVKHIWLSGDMCVYADVAEDCYNKGGERTSRMKAAWVQIEKIPHLQHPKQVHNHRLTRAIIDGGHKGTGTVYTTGCMSLYVIASGTF